jgi:hypothetical protein
MNFPSVQIRWPKALTTSVVATTMFGVAFLIRCEHSPTLPGGWPSCWIVSGSIMGVPFMKSMAEKAGFVNGYNTYNPALRKPREEDEVT